MAVEVKQRKELGNKCSFITSLQNSSSSGVWGYDSFLSALKMLWQLGCHWTGDTGLCPVTLSLFCARRPVSTALENNQKTKLPQIFFIAEIKSSKQRWNKNRYRIKVFTSVAINTILLDL